MEGSVCVCVWGLFVFDDQCKKVVSSHNRREGKKEMKMLM